MNRKRKTGLSVNQPGTEYAPDQIEFMMWMHKCKERTGVYKPSWAEVLRWAKALGYRKVETKLTP